MEWTPNTRPRRAALFASAALCAAALGGVPVLSYATRGPVILSTLGGAVIASIGTLYFLRSFPAAVIVTPEIVRIRRLLRATEIRVSDISAADFLVEERYVTRKREDRICTVVLKVLGKGQIRLSGVEGVIAEHLMRVLPVESATVRIYHGSKAWREMSVGEYLVS